MSATSRVFHEGELPDALRGAELLRRRGPADTVQVVLVHPDGTQEVAPLPGALAGMIANVLEKAAAAEGTATGEGAAEVSPEDAASILGIAPALVRRRMHSGVLPFRRVGTDHRLRLDDVLALQRREAATREALAELQADTGDLMARGL